MAGTTVEEEAVNGVSFDIIIIISHLIYFQHLARHLIII